MGGSCDVLKSAWVLDETIPRTLTHGESATHARMVAPFTFRLSDAGARAPLGCDIPGTNHTVTTWPPALEAWLPAFWQTSTRIPAIDPRCRNRGALPDSSSIRIVGVDDGHRFQRHGDAPFTPTITLTAEGAVEPCYWFVNGELHAERSKSVTLALTGRKNQLVVLDQQGATAMRLVHNDNGAVRSAAMFQSAAN